MMDTANEDDIRDVERNIVKRSNFPGDCALDEKRTSPAPERKPCNKMLFLRHFIFTIFTVSLVAVTLVSGLSPIRVPRSPTLEDQKKFQEIIASTGGEPSSLHDSMRKHLSNYKIDAYNEAKVVVADEEEQNEESASSLVNFLKRQETSNTNGTTVAPPGGLTTETTQTTATATTTETTSITSSTITTETQPPPNPTTSSSTTQPTTAPTTAPSASPTTSPSTTPPSPTTNPPPVETSKDIPPSATTKDSSVPTPSEAPTKGMYTETRWVIARSIFGPTSSFLPFPTLAPYANSTCFDSATSEYTSLFRGAYVSGARVSHSTELLSLCVVSSLPIAFPVDISSRSSDFSQSPFIASPNPASVNSEVTISKPLSTSITSSGSLGSGTSYAKTSSAMSHRLVSTKISSIASAPMNSLAISQPINSSNSSFGASKSNTFPTTAHIPSPVCSSGSDSVASGRMVSSTLSPASSSGPSDTRSDFVNPTCTILPSLKTTSLGVFVTSVPTTAANATFPSYISGPPAPVVTQEPITASSSELLSNTSFSSGPNINITVDGSSALNPAGSPVIYNSTFTVSSQRESNIITAPTITTSPPPSSTEIPQSLTSIAIFTTTSANGDIATITRTTIVQAGAADKTVAGGASKTKSGSIGLQTNDATRGPGGTGVIMAFILAIGGYLTLSL